MQRFSRQNWRASHCRKDARPCRKAGRRAFPFPSLGRVPGPAGPGFSQPGQASVGSKEGPGCRADPHEKLAEPRRVVVPGGAGALRDERALATPRFRSCAPPPGTGRLLAAAQRPGRATRVKFSLSPSSAAQAELRPRSWEGLPRTGPGNDDGTSAGSGSLSLARWS